MKNLYACVLFALGLISCNQQNYADADAKSFAELIDTANVVLLDVRTPSEFAEGHIAGAINIDQASDDFIDKVKANIPIDKHLAVYCKAGVRSARSSKRLADQGYECTNLLGGIISWKGSGRPVIVGNYEVDTFTSSSGKTLKFYALMHSCIRIQYDSLEIEIDPVAQLGNRVVDYSAMPQADYIFVTHEHGDHYDAASIEKLSKDSTQLITNQRCADMYGSGIAMNNGDKLQLANYFAVEAVPAYNTTEGREMFHPKGRDNGYILTIDSVRIYIAGDTEDIPEMESIKNIDIAFLPCNQPYTMTPEQLVNAAKIIKPKVLFPYHYGQTNVSEIPSLLQSENIDVRIRHYE